STSSVVYDGTVNVCIVSDIPSTVVESPINTCTPTNGVRVSIYAKRYAIGVCRYDERTTRICRADADVAAVVVHVGSVSAPLSRDILEMSQYQHCHKADRDEPNHLDCFRRIVLHLIPLS